MKKNILLIIILACVALSASAQIGDRRNELSIGGSIGYSLNRMSFQPRIRQNFKNSMYFGFAARYMCEKYFNTLAGVQVEVNYMNLGWNERIEDGTNNTYVRDFQTIEIPLLMHMGWGRERRGLKFYFEAGPQLGVILKSTEHMGGDPWNPNMRPNYVNYQYGMEPKNRFDYGIAAGLGAELSTAIGHFLVGGRYYYGLADIFDNSKAGKFGRSCNMTIQVKLTYLFDIIKTKKE